MERDGFVSWLSKNNEALSFDTKIDVSLKRDCTFKIEEGKEVHGQAHDCTQNGKWRENGRRVGYSYTTKSQLGAFKLT